MTSPETHQVRPEMQPAAENAALMAQFGLGDIFKIEETIDNRIDRFESSIRSRVPNILQPLLPDDLLSLENQRIFEFSNYFDKELPEFERQPEDIQDILERITHATGQRHGMVYVSYPEEGEGLNFLLFAPNTPPQTLYTEERGHKEITALVDKFRADLVMSLRRKNVDYKKTSRELYDIVIAPIVPYLQASQIDSLIFSLDEGLRSLPIAALYDGDRYLIEKYSLAVVPSFYNINSSYMSLKKSPVLAMGADSFKELDPLPGVEVEVGAIANLTQGQSFLNETFTVENLKQTRQSQRFPIVHLATHAQFNSGKPKKSSIYLWNDELRLSELDKLNLDNPPLDLLVLSACQTALGSRDAELGFSGLTIASGATSALGSLWSVSDAGTLVLMQNFYQKLQTEPTKAAALRRAQLEMLHGDLQIVNGQVRLASGLSANIQISEKVEAVTTNDLMHPYYWSGFTLVGRPW
ncbi:CHAT domain-containing protein [[Limnothrix rosea] IAM M-220]|uniref:CHAT domain-containing protein n=1 Tax=[Limnothrix rosea] IAM M-220 TaxID=454133 RepID=UPI0015591D35|nr:CHAT domain-containing protein [[Limnothrix rosea] IAM M-220]